LIIGFETGGTSLSKKVKRLIAKGRNRYQGLLAYLPVDQSQELRAFA